MSWQHLLDVNSLKKQGAAQVLEPLGAFWSLGRKTLLELVEGLIHPEMNFWLAPEVDAAEHFALLDRPC